MDAIEQLVGIVESLVVETRGWLPYHPMEVANFRSSNQMLPPDTRTKLAFLEDKLKKAEDIAKQVRQVQVSPRIHNPNCDGSHCVSETSEVRVLPLSPQSNLILCQACHEYELSYRRGHNRKLNKEGQFKLPTWEELPKYG